MLSKPRSSVYENEEFNLLQAALDIEDGLELLSFQLLKVCLLIKKLVKRTLVGKLSLTFGNI